MNIKPTREAFLQALLISINDSKYLSMFPGQMGAEYSKLGYTATTNQTSKIRQLLEVQSHALMDLFSNYELPEPRKIGGAERRLLRKAKIAQEKTQEKTDRERFDELEKAWKEDEPRAQQEILENAEKAAQNIFNKNQELKKTRE